MYHRLVESEMGLGNPEPCTLNNNYILDKDKWQKFLKDFSAKYSLIQEFGRFDFRYDPGSFAVGIEPTYMYDKLLIIKFDLTDKKNCSLTKGVAFGAYGSDKVTETRFYKDYKRKSKFTVFIDKWYKFVKEYFNG